MPEVALIAYAMMIPVVPLVGFEMFKKRKDRMKQGICILLFVAQLVISGAAIYSRYFT